jgi:glycine/D-amino acid oxidase-like deaminating enzyme
MFSSNNFDVIVIGGGPIGLSSAYHLSERRVRTLLLEQFTFVNQLGSSAGVSRQFRIPYPEKYMVKLVKQSIPFWDELQSLSSVPLLDKVGTLWFGDPTVHTSEGNIAEAETALKGEGIPYTSLNRADLEEQYHFTNLPDNYVGLFQEQGASINLKATIETIFDTNRNSPFITMKSETRVSDIVHKDDRFYVTTPLGVFSAAKLILTPGPFANGVFHLLNFQIQATYWNMASAFYKVLDPTIKYPTWFVFQNPQGDNGNEFYGFPEVGWNYPGYIRVASDFVIKPLDSPDQRTFIPNPQELAFTVDWVRQHMTGINPVPEFTSTCLVALSKIPNKELLIDFAPPNVAGYKDVVLYATGWAAKFVPILGRILSDLALDGRTDFDISNFPTGDKYLTAFIRPANESSKA